MIAGVADTHAAIWRLFDDPMLSAAARRFIGDAAVARQKIALSPISLAEVVYLIEKKRLPMAAYTDLRKALSDPNHVLVSAGTAASAAPACIRFGKRRAAVSL